MDQNWSKLTDVGNKEEQEVTVGEKCNKMFGFVFI